jgi:hypothetical protein
VHARIFGSPIFHSSVIASLRQFNSCTGMNADQHALLATVGIQSYRFYAGIPEAFLN